MRRAIWVKLYLRIVDTGIKRNSFEITCSNAELKSKFRPRDYTHIRSTLRHGTNAVLQLPCSSR